MSRIIDESDVIKCVMYGAWSDENELIKEIKTLPAASSKVIANITFDADEIIEKIQNEYMIYKWIPVKEQLPKECGYYLISTKYDVWYAVFGIDNDGGVWLSATGLPIRLTDEVVAWMPMPDSYKGEE